MTPADVMIETLINWGVEVIFGFPGDGINGIFESIRTHAEKIDFVQVRHEEAAAFMATGYAKFTGQLGVCLAASGPGGIHLLNGLYDAKMDGQPVLAITGMAHQRTPEAPFPGLYTRADWPQAWTASSSFTILQALTGVYGYAPANMLILDPHLPEWLPEITVERLRIGKAMVSLQFFRTADGKSDYKIIDLQGTLHVLRQPSPWSFTADWGERVKDAISSLLPHGKASIA